MNDYKIGSIIKCDVSGIETYGIFVNVDENYKGLIHISEVSNSYVKDINSFVSIGEKIYCQILDIDDTNKQLKLSIKNINYKTISKSNSINESRKGFLPLKNALPSWIDEKMKEYNLK